MGTMPKVQYRRESLVELYKSHTLDEIGEMLGYRSRTPVKRLFRLHDIPLRTRGKGPNGGNRGGTGLEFDESDLRSNLSHERLAEKYSTSLNTVKRARLKLGIRRKKPYTKEYHIYNSRVRSLTMQTYRRHKDILNPDDLPRGVCGTDGAYQIDHIKSVRECFDEGVSPQECAALNNLELVTWQENLNRRVY